MNFFNMSFEEKSTWGALVIILLVFSGYFAQVFQGLVNATLNKADASSLFIGAVVTLIALEIGLHIVIAMFNVRDTEQPSDERDKLFAMKAGNISGWVLGLGVMVVATYTFVHDLSSLWVANLLLFVVYLSQVVSYALQLLYYRRGY